MKTSREFSFTVAPFENYDEFQAAMAEIGNTVAKARIEVKGNGRAMLHSAAPMSLHTDHPAVDVIAWYCARQSDEGGESLLLDFERIRGQLLPEHLTELQEVRVNAPAVPTLGPPSSVPMLCDAGLYYAEWLLEPGLTSASKAAVDAFLQAVERTPPARIRLEEGQALIINNKRVMHGRSQIVERYNRRLLIRHWIQYAATPGNSVTEAIKPQPGRESMHSV